ncbi:hypothetical protein [Mucilaginibacter jinjuensis]|uniref:YD repeat-containing protein n=1 Tax=Mucilaginibacter jinjuensis TaxID=1176721 RepID=A0ABY7T965_9SPHI|nr:hypothetical protein [Mucilaginibacter jinjuensis]WCT12881.1 hypothetical protein PQO05_02900 [Mucilaginibacter jinjuensis]
MKILYLIAILCFTNTCFAQKIKSDLEKENLKGNVLSVTTTRRDTVSAKIINKEIATYNNDGNLVSNIRYDSLFKGDTASTRINYEYRNHRLVESVRYHTVKKSAVRSTYSYHTLENEVEQRDYTFRDNILLGSFVSRYDEAGNITRLTTYDGHNHVAMETWYKYNHGNLVSEERKPVNGETTTITMAYDAMDNKMSETVPDAKGKVRASVYHYFNYDKQYNWLSMDEPGGNNRITERVIIYYK